ncbi:MAG: hypothetical protein KKF44_05365 [Nanoarchaeota archaeon]|nr:hypothetical protein [Nanoarchaeota archaeon]
MRKRGATVINYVMIIGLLIVGFIAMTALKRIFFWEASEIHKDEYQVFYDTIKDIVEKSTIFPVDSFFNLTFKDSEEYTLTIENNQLSVYFPKKDILIKETLIVSNYNIIPNTFTTSGVINVINKGRNIYLTEHIHCDLSDRICDPGCIANSDMTTRCDSACYWEYVKDVCISYCIDVNMDGVINSIDADNYCDPDCYNSVKNGGIYDIDCLESGDKICDPDTHMVEDEYCDLDCIGDAPDFIGNFANGVCDLDCNKFDIDCPLWFNQGFA